MASEDGNVEEVEVIVGTYEEFLLGYKLATDEKDKYSLSMTFTNHSHSKSIRAVTTVGKYMASGSADENINLVNMSARVEHGSLQEQSGTITCLTQHDGNYLFSGCEDGTICIWKRGSWLCEKTLKAHTDGVVDISVHPSGKLALSIGKDKAMKTWNLVKGRCGYVTNLKVVADAVRWSPDGDYYAVSLSNRVDVYSLQTAKIVYSIPAGKRISCLTFTNNSTLIVAGDKESIEVHDIESGKKLTEFNAHKNRVKSILHVPELDMLFTSSNDGFIKVWRFSEENYSKNPDMLTEIDTSCRITCMTVWMKITGDEENNAAEEQEDENVEEEEELDDNDSADSSESDQEDEAQNKNADSDSDSEEDRTVVKKRRFSKNKPKVSNQKPNQGNKSKFKGKGSHSGKHKKRKVN